MKIVDTIEELCSRVDAVLLESVDGRVHLEQVRPIFKAKKRVFIDKPLTASLADGREIARLSKEPFGSYIALGVVAMLFWPAAINVAMVIGLAPVVGIPLPLLSYGGSALVTCWIGIGLLMNVSMRRYLF